MVVLLVVGGVVIFQLEGLSEFHSSGFVLVELAAMFGGIRWVLTQILLKGEGDHDLKLSGTMDTLYHVAPCMALTLAPVALATEWSHIMNSPMLGSASVQPTLHPPALSRAALTENVAGRIGHGARNRMWGNHRVWVDGGRVPSRGFRRFAHAIDRRHRQGDCDAGVQPARPRRVRRSPSGRFR